MVNKQVAIVGGGLAGLYAARLLHKAGIEFVLYEARERVGGRILTIDATGAPALDGFDLGPSWFWPEAQPAIGAVVDELGLAAFRQASAGDVVFERMSREAPQRYQSRFVEPPSMRLVGGTAALVQALLRDLPAEKILRGYRVSELKLCENGIDLTIADHNDVSRVHKACAVIAAMPPRLLEATVTFDPPQDAEIRKLWRETPTWMAPSAKFIAIYDQPFWHAAGLSGTAQSLVGPLAEIHDASTASGQSALFGFLGISADQRANHGNEPLTRACLAQLARIYGPMALAPRATPYKDWAADSLTATALDRVSAGHVVPRTAPWVLGSWADRLTLGGSETSPSEPGYLAGAIAAAERAVAATLINIRV